MRIRLHIGPLESDAAPLQRTLDARRGWLANRGVLVPRSLGARNHTRLYMAVTDPGHVDPLRHGRGYGDPVAQARLRAAVAGDLAREVDKARPETLILTAAQLGGSLYRAAELHRLRDLLRSLSDDIDIVAQVDEPARHLARHYAHAVMEGRARSLDAEMALAGDGDWWDGAIGRMPRIAPEAGIFEETQGLPFWLDTARLVSHWQSVFGDGTVHLTGPGTETGIADLTGIDKDIAAPGAPPPGPSAAWLARARAMNALFLQVLKNDRYRLPRKLWRGLLGEIAIDGPPVDPGALAPVSARFAASSAALCDRFPHLRDTLSAPVPTDTWREADPGRGFRATQYLLAFMHRIEAASREARAQGRDEPAANPALPPAAVRTLERLRASPFAPHNRIGSVDEETAGSPYPPAEPRQLRKGSTGNVIVGCMKNEAPYILEWVAYHRAIGVDGFLIYTNGCEDGTDAILDRLQEMGVVQHRRNDDWKGNSPQQHALNLSLKENVIRNADWIIHIDVDEFINVRCGNGTLADLFAAIPGATNVAMTWRLFGHNGVQELDDRFVIDQFDRCAPKFCPKPHTVWGFKTMFRNIGAYQKISCHRPNKLAPKFRKKVKWVNGSGRDMSAEVRDNGWRNSKGSIGYDLVQLNHYALRSAESFLIKRQRGRALHVDRSIGLNYWIRMDWCDHRDLTIKRNLPRLDAAYDDLLRDDALRALHEQGVSWHRAKVGELHAQPEFEDLYQRALKIDLTGVERAAYALTLDMES